MNRDLLIGGMSGIISRTLTAPLELWKIQKQNYFMPNSTIKDVVKKEGIRYLWKGNFTNCVRIFPQYSVNFAVYGKINKSLETHIKNKNIDGLQIKSSCGCTTANPKHTSEGISLEVNYDTTRLGSFNKNVIMRYNIEGEQKQTTINIKGNVKNEL